MKSLLCISVALMAAYDNITGSPAGAAEDLDKRKELLEQSRADINIDIDENNTVELVYELGERRVACEFNVDEDPASTIADRLEAFAKSVREREEWNRNNPPTPAVRNAEVDQAADARAKAVEAASDEEIERTLADRRGQQHVQMERDARAERSGGIVEAMPPGASDPIKPGPTEGRDTARSDQV